MARAAFSGDEVGPIRVLARRDGAPAIAFLLTIGCSGGDVVLPLREGRNFVGRGIAGSEPYGVLLRPQIVEQAQWFILCAPNDARVVDAGSTNLSVLCPRAQAQAVAAHAFGWAEMEKLPGAVVLPHLNTFLRPGAQGDAEDAAIAHHATALHEGDRLRSAYATFVFAWARPAMTSSPTSSRRA